MGKSFMSKELWCIGHITDVGGTKPKSSSRWSVGNGRLEDRCTNKANFAEVSACETNPIWRLRISDCGLGTALRRSGRLCQTNPIRPPPRSRGRRNAQNEPKLENQSCEANPIPVASGRSRARTPNLRRGALRQTKPIPRSPAGPRDCAKRSQSGSVPPAGRAIVQNKPNLAPSSGPRRAKRAKRTQLPEAGHRGGVGGSAGRRNTQYSTILSFHHSSPTKTIGKLRGGFGSPPALFRRWEPFPIATHRDWGPRLRLPLPPGASYPWSGWREDLLADCCPAGLQL